MTAPRRYRIVLAKEDFKFSAAHFTIFGEEQGELLHGHNYQVAAELGGSALSDLGLLADIESAKRVIRGACARLDSRTLVPEESPLLSWSRNDGMVELRFGPRLYRLPADDVLFLPLSNTSMELLARMLWEELAAHLAGSRVETLGVSVEESAGQRCFYEGRLEL
jgi:6-pyruvoyltetrahydropterin/6-carboxytetrahydropterin synthase